MRAREHETSLPAVLGAQRGEHLERELAILVAGSSSRGRAGTRRRPPAVASPASVAPLFRDRTVVDAEMCDVRPVLVHQLLRERVGGRVLREEQNLVRERERHPRQPLKVVPSRRTNVRTRDCGTRSDPVRDDEAVAQP